MKTALLTLALTGMLYSQPANLKFPPLGKITKPDVQVTTLPNGVKLYLMENHCFSIFNRGFNTCRDIFQLLIKLFASLRFRTTAAHDFASHTSNTKLVLRFE